MNEIRPVYDEHGDLIGATQTMEVTRAQARSIENMMELEVYRTALESIRDFHKQRGIPQDAAYAANTMADLARTALAKYEKLSEPARPNPWRLWFNEAPPMDVAKIEWRSWDGEVNTAYRSGIHGCFLHPEFNVHGLYWRLPEKSTSGSGE